MSVITFGPTDRISNVDDFNLWLAASGVKIVDAPPTGMLRSGAGAHVELANRRIFNPTISSGAHETRAVLEEVAEAVKYHFAVHGGKTIYIRIPLETDTFPVQTPLSHKPDGNMTDFYTERKFHGVMKYRIAKAYFRFSASAYLDELMEIEETTA